MRVPVTLLRIQSAVLLAIPFQCAAGTQPLGAAQRADSLGSLTTEYRAYVVAESSDLVHRIRVGPEGATVDNTVGIDQMPMETDGPHGVAVDPEGRYAYVTTGHGVWNGNLWKLEVGSDTVVAGPLTLGRFPATVDVDPSGTLAIVANFNLHGEMVPSSLSVVYLPDFIEVARTETCTMPHGSRFHPDGTRHYSVCMMDDQLVELETRRFSVARRFLLDPADPRPLEADELRPSAEPPGHGPDSAVCSPTWASPSPDGSRIYVACNVADVVMEIDVERWEILRSFDTGPGPYNLEVTPDGRILVVTLKQGDAVEFFDLESGESVERVDTSTEVAHGVAISSDGHLALISVEGIGTEPGRVDVINLDGFRRIDSLEVGLQAAGIAFLYMGELDPSHSSWE